MAFKNYGASEAYGIYVGPSTRGRVQNCSAINCLAGGIFVAAGATDFLIDNAVVDNPYCTTHSGGVIAPTTTSPRYVEFGATGSGALSGLVSGARMLKTDPSIGAYVGVLGYLVRDGSGVVARAVNTLMDGVTIPVFTDGTTTRFRQDEGSKTHDFGSLIDGAGETTSVTVTGAALGNFAQASLSVDLQGMTMTAWVSAADTVSVRVQNETGGTIDLGSATLRAYILQSTI
jgi:hypothetical protein